MSAIKEVIGVIGEEFTSYVTGATLVEVKSWEHGVVPDIDQLERIVQVQTLYHTLIENIKDNPAFVKLMLFQPQFGTDNDSSLINLVADGEYGVAVKALKDWLETDEA